MSVPGPAETMGARAEYALRALDALGIGEPGPPSRRADPEHGRLLLRALRSGTAPAAERTQELTYLQLQVIDDIPQAPCQRRVLERATTCASSATRRSAPSF